MMFAALLCAYFGARPSNVRNAVMAPGVVDSQLMSSQLIPPAGAMFDAIDATCFRVSV